MADIPEVTTSLPSELLGAGRRHLAVKDYSAAVETLAKACEQLSKEHGDTADQCAEAYLWYGKALLGLAREESGVFGDGMPGTGNVDEEDDDNEDDNDGDNGETEGEQLDDAEKNNEVEEKNDINEKEDKIEAQSTQEEPSSSTVKDSAADKDMPGTSNGEANDEATLDMDDNEVDNLQLAWEVLELARSILQRRAEDGTQAARALLADTHLALGEVALEAATYDKAVIDMQSCLEIQKQLYRNDDRRIAETHYQIGLANSLASSFEEAITHFKNAANILESRIKTLENPVSASEDDTVKKYVNTDAFYSVEGEIKELKELLPEIQEKINDMMDCKAETIKCVRESLCPSNGEGSHMNGAGGSASGPKPAASDISHLIKRKRKASDGDTDNPAPKRTNT